MKKNRFEKLQTIIIENDGNLLTASQIYEKLTSKWGYIGYRSPNSLAHSGLKKIKLEIIKSSPTIIKTYICDKMKCPLWELHGIRYRRYMKI